ncbi:MAG TPA: cytochrome b/b6 domain-containing protein [Acetobacteraceae bacterium]|nr:cytochrome b/b6 domain-containing protein [Acetobacteraceae bacterium]
MATEQHNRTRSRWIVIHPLMVRLTHWVNAVAIVCMVMSGWGIYNASPLFGFTFPPWATLGGWLGGAIAWHLATMWLLAGNALVYVAYGLLSGHFVRSFLPLRPELVWRDLMRAVSLRLSHPPGTYNAVQRLAYVGVLMLGALAVLSGLALWKPVQLQTLAALLGGYETARRIHFLAMAGIVGFVGVHLILVALVPHTLPGMLSGRARVSATAPKGVP